MEPGSGYQESWMSDYEECGSPSKHAVQGALEVLWVKCAKALVENDDVGVL